MFLRSEFDDFDKLYLIQELGKVVEGMVNVTPKSL